MSNHLSRRKNFGEQTKNKDCWICSRFEEYKKLGLVGIKAADVLDLMFTKFKKSFRGLYRGKIGRIETIKGPFISKWSEEYNILFW